MALGRDVLKFVNQFAISTAATTPWARLAVKAGITRAATMSTGSLPQYETLLLSRSKENVVQVQLNRPEKRNAMNKPFWREMVECFNGLNEDPECRSVIICGAGKSFTSGLDLADAAQDLFSHSEKDTARTAFYLRDYIIKPYQMTFTSIEKCTKPVIAAVHGACVGGGIDLITACDIRVCTQDTWFQIKEVDIGLAADVGTLQRLPKVIGNESLARELVYTARKFTAEEAQDMGLVSKIFPDQSTMMEAAVELASLIATKSPVAVQGSKVNLNYSRDHTVDESLDYMATWNMSMLQTEDLMKAVQAQILKEAPVFSKL